MKFFAVVSLAVMVASYDFGSSYDGGSGYSGETVEIDRVIEVEGSGIDVIGVS